jgi:type IV secretion system protein TrbJ
MISMSHNRSRSRLAQILVLVCAALAPVRADAQFGLLGSGIVFDPSNFARNILHYARRLEQMNLQRQQLQPQVPG